MIEQLKRGKGSQDGTSSFQSLMMSLAGRVGMGNIGGVATAIAFGGPGAVFWMWTSAFLGGATSFIESTLGQIYKEKDPDTGEYRGGPAYYFEKAYKHKARGLSLTHGILFAVVTILAMSFFLPGVQANGMASAVDTAWGILTWITAIGLVILLAFIVIGGVKRIAHFAVIVVPAMALLYILIAVVVFFVNFTEIPRVFELIFSSAFGVQPVFGAILGLAVKWGVQRGIYSNEAGQGTGPHAAAAAEVSHPAKEGLAQSFAVYVDTQFVCSATAFIIISTVMFNTFAGDPRLSGAHCATLSRCGPDCPGRRPRRARHRGLDGLPRDLVAGREPGRLTAHPRLRHPPAHRGDRGRRRRPRGVPTLGRGQWAALRPPRDSTATASAPQGGN